MKRINIFLHLLGMALVLTACSEWTFDPADVDAIPCSPADTWNRDETGVQPVGKKGFPIEELSDDMPLSKLLDIALTNNPTTQVTWNAAKAAAYAFRASLSPYYPTIDYTGILQIEKSNLVGSGTNTGNVSTITAPGAAVSTWTSLITINYLLFDFGGREGAVNFAAEVLFAADWQHNRAIQTVILSVITDYTNYLGNQGLVHAAKQDLKDAEVALKAAESMRKAGLSTMTDVMQAKAVVAQKQLSVISAEGAMNTSLGQLIVTIGLPPDTQLSLENLPQHLPIVEISGEISTLFEIAKKRRPDLGAAVAAIKQQEAQLQIAFSSGMPQLNAFSTLSQLDFVNVKRKGGYDNTLGLELTYPIFQGFYYLNLQRQIKAQIAEAAANLNLQITQVALDIVTSYYALVTAINSIPASEAFLSASELAYKGQVAQYKVGTASITDVLNALTILSDARSAVTIAKTNWAASLANLSYAVGILDDISPYWKSDTLTKEASNDTLTNTKGND